MTCVMHVLLLPLGPFKGKRNFSLIYLAAHCEQQVEFLISHLEVTSLLLSLSFSVNEPFQWRIQDFPDWGRQR